jgi:hypothetical protein
VTPVATDPPVRYAPVGHCIYCPDDGKAADEHIIPYALNGAQILPAASCSKCGGVTSSMELILCRDVFWQLRAHARMQTRREFPDEFPVTLVFDDGHEEKVMAPVAVHPATLVVPHFTIQPDLLSGRTPDGNFHFRTRAWQRQSDTFDEYVRARGAISGSVDLQVKPQQFARAIAKIAHSYAVARLGLTGFEPLLIDLIHGRNVQKAPELVGGEPEIPPPASGVLHQLDLVPNTSLIVVRLRLFASSSINGEHAFPVYHVVAGKSH